MYTVSPQPEDHHILCLTTHTHHAVRKHALHFWYNIQYIENGELGVQVSQTKACAASTGAAVLFQDSSTQTLEVSFREKQGAGFHFKYARDFGRIKRVERGESGFACLREQWLSIHCYYAALHSLYPPWKRVVCVVGATVSRHENIDWELVRFRKPKKELALGAADDPPAHTVSCIVETTGKVANRSFAARHWDHVWKTGSSITSSRGHWSWLFQTKCPQIYRSHFLRGWKKK